MTVIVSFENKYCELLCLNSMLILPCYMSQNRKRFVYYRASAFIHECVRIHSWMQRVTLVYFRPSVLSLSITLKGHSWRGPSIQDWYKIFAILDQRVAVFQKRCEIERKFQWLTILYRINNLVIDDLGWHQGHLDYFKARAVDYWNVQIYFMSGS